MIAPNENKPRWDLMPLTQLNEVAKVYTFGANKYSDKGYATRDPKEYLGATLRHIVAYSSGESKDSESGLRHLAHAVTDLLIMMEIEDNKTEPKTEPKTREIHEYKDVPLGARYTCKFGTFIKTDPTCFPPKTLCILEE